MIDLDQGNEGFQSSMNSDNDKVKPKVDMEFDTLDDVGRFWYEYGQRMGFGVRKEYSNVNKRDKVITSAVYVCNKHGHKRQRKQVVSNAMPRWGSKTDCRVKLMVSLDREKGKYKVKEFVEEHNHVLEPKETTNMLRSYRNLSTSNALAIDSAHDSTLALGAIHDLFNREAGVIEKFCCVKEDQKSYFMSKRKRNMEHGELGGILKYFEKQKKNMIFDYSLQLDEDELVTSIFWVDAGMMVDYEVFGDVVVFDTTFGTNKEGRPLGVFTGFNHHRQIVIFGGALLYDETINSFVWLFETFINSHGGKKPKTIFTDQEDAMASALELVLPNTKHGLCTWHIMQNAGKHLSSYMKGDSGLLGDFRRCVYDIIDEIDFEKEWLKLLEKHDVKDNDWLKRIYLLKEKWANCFMKQDFTLGIQSSQLSQSLNNDFRRCLDHKLSIEDFFKLFDRIIEQKRIDEAEAEFHARQLLPSLLNQHSALLKQAAMTYTPSIFKQFQDEFMLALSVKISDRDVSQSLQKYIAHVHDSNEKKCIVFYDETNSTIICSCKKFEAEGILCRHSLKVYIILDIMEIPEKYILSRWTRGVKSGYDTSGEELGVEEDRHAWHKRMNSLFLKMSYQASMDKSTRASVEKMVNIACKEVFDFSRGK